MHIVSSKKQKQHRITGDLLKLYQLIQHILGRYGFIGP